MFFGTGGKVLHISRDWKNVVVQLKLGIWTRNYVGTIFGGSQFAAADPMFMLMLFHNFGKDHVVWDKSGAIKFKKPGRGKIKAHFEFTEAEFEQIRQKVADEGKYEFVKEVSWTDNAGDVISIVEKTLYIAQKEYYRERQAEKKLAKEQT